MTVVMPNRQLRFHQRVAPDAPQPGGRRPSGGVGGGVNRGASVKRSPPSQPMSPPAPNVTPMPTPRRFGGQERGSATDAATTLNRNAPGGSPQGGSPVTDPNALSRFITPENTLRNQRLGFDVREMQPGSQEQTFQRMMDAVLPAHMDQFQNQARGIAQRTSALGRTGSGMVDREFADLENQQERAIHSIMGQLAAQASGQDIQNQMMAQGQNQQVDLARQAHMFQERGREDQLARQAMQDRAQQMGFLNRGFASDPTGTLLGAGQMGMMGAGEFGANAGMANQALGGLAGAGAQQPGGIGGVISRIFGTPQGGGQLPPVPGPVQAPRPGGMNTDFVPQPQPFNPNDILAR